MNISKKKKIRNRIFITVMSTLVVAFIYFILSIGLSIYEIQKTYKYDKLYLEKNILKTNEKIEELRVDYLDVAKNTNNKFDSIYKNLEDNSKEHKAISGELNQLTYVIQKNNDAMKEDLQFIKNIQTNRPNYNFAPYITDNYEQNTPIN
jgi:predicted PurR-regulated permease PerM